MMRGDSEGDGAANGDDVRVDDVAEEVGWDDLAEAPLAFDPDDLVCEPCDDEVADSDGGHFQLPRGVPMPKAPFEGSAIAPQPHSSTICVVVPLVHHGAQAQRCTFQVQGWI